MANELKDGIAKAVQDGLPFIMGLANIRADSVEVTSTDKLNTQIRVKPANGAPRYFNVKVSEGM